MAEDKHGTNAPYLYNRISFSASKTSRLSDFTCQHGETLLFSQSCQAAQFNAETDNRGRITLGSASTYKRLIMEVLLRHLIDQNWAEITAKSLLHCHAKNLHSVMLLDSSEKRIRLFVADIGNPLDRNYPDAVTSDSSPLSIAFHPHHCNVTLAPILGTLTNWLIWNLPGNPSIELDSFLYQSAITSGNNAKFVKERKSTVHTRRIDILPAGSEVYLSARDIHTVAAPSDRITAWLVLEGLEDRSYEPRCWSNDALDSADFSDLYKRPSEQEVVEVLKLAELGHLL